MPLSIDQWTRPTRLLHLTIDDIAARDPDRIWASFPTSPGDFKRWRNVTFAEFARAIDRVAWRYEEHFGRSKNFEAIAYLGAPDIRYAIASMAAAKTGYAAMFPSQTNSLEGHLSLLEACSCERIMTSEDSKVDDILGKRSMHHIQMPSVIELLDSKPVDKYKYTKEPIQAVLDPWLILHTSGTTGLPKPIHINHGYAAAFEKASSLKAGEGPQTEVARMVHADDMQGRLLAPFAPFHIVCSHWILALTIWHNSTYVLARTERLPDTADILEALKHGSIDTFCAAPYQLEAFSKSDEALEVISKLRMVYYGGGGLPEHVGDKICKQTTLRSVFGSTELGPAPQLQANSEDWAYMGFDRTLMNLELRPVAGDDTLVEPVVIHSADPAIEQFQPVFMLFPDRTEWPLGDMCKPHPTRPHLLRHAGRADDVIMFAHGLKFVPLGLEHAAMEVAGVRAALLCGHGHLQPVCLVELDGSQTESSGNEALRTQIADVSKRFPSTARIEKTHILFLKPGQEFERTPKGTVKRQATVAAFKDALEGVWREHGDHAHDMMGGRTQ